MRCSPAATRSPGVTAIVQNGSPFTYFQNRPIEIADGPTLDSGTLCGVRAAPCHAAVDALDRPARVCTPRARVSRHRQVTGLSELHRVGRARTGECSLPLQVDGDYLGEASGRATRSCRARLTVVA